MNGHYFFFCPLGENVFPFFLSWSTLTFHRQPLSVSSNSGQAVICYHLITHLGKMTYPDASFASLAITFPVSTGAWGRMLIRVKATTLWISFSVPMPLPTTSKTAVTHSSPLRWLFVEKKATVLIGVNCIREGG